MATETLEPDVIDVKQTALARSNGVSNPMTLLEKMIDNKVDPTQLGGMMALCERWEANQARKAFYEAITLFKQNPPEILKNKQVSYTTDKGTTSYRHATLGESCAAIAQGLGKYGLSHRWESKQPDGGLIEVTCILSHELGHCERTMLRSMPDASGGKNAIQAVASAVTYLERYTLMAATGIAAQDDDDGAGAEPPDPELVKEQTGQINGLLEECENLGFKVDFPKFLKWLKEAGCGCDDKGWADMDKMTPKLFAKAMSFLTDKRKNAEKKAAQTKREPGVE